MADFSHSLQRTQPSSATFSKKISNGNGFATKTVFDDVFGGPPKFGISSGVEDYSEIFGSYHSSRGSSIPILDLQVVDEAHASIDVQNSKLDYAEVFGGFDCLDFAVPYEELFLEPKRGERESSSEEAWTPAETGSPSEGSSEELPSSENNQAFTNGEFHHSYDDVKLFNMSYHKTNQISKEDRISGTTHIAHLNAVPAFSYVVDEGIPLTEKCEKSPFQVVNDENCSVSSNGGVMKAKHSQKTKSEKRDCDTVSKTSRSVNSSGGVIMEGKHLLKTTSEEPACDTVTMTSNSVDSNGGVMEGKHLLKTTAEELARDTSKSVNSDGGVMEVKHIQKTTSDELACDAFSRTSRTDLKPQSNPSGNGTCPAGVFLTVSEINLRTQPCHVPPPSRPPPKLATKQGDSKRWMNSNLKASTNYTCESAKSEGSPPFFDVEIDASSSAAASAAAMKEAMEKAQIRLKSAKESMERKRDGLQNRKKLGLKEDINRKERREGDSVQEGCRVKEDKSHENFEEEDSQLNGFDREPRQRVTGVSLVAPIYETSAKVLNVSQDSVDQKHVNEYRSTQESSKLGKGAGEWKAEDQFYELVKKDKFETLQDAPEQKKVERKSGPTIEVFEQEQNDKTTSKAVFEQQEENDGKLQDAAVMLPLEEYAEKVKVAKGARDLEENDKGLKEAHDLEKSEKKLNGSFEPEEHERKLRKDREREEYENKLKEACEPEKHDKKLKQAFELEEYELKEAREREEHEKRQKESCERKENERKLKEARQREEYEKRQQEAREREENEKRLRESHEREEYEKKLLEEVQEREESEMRRKEVCEENERRLKEALEQEVQEKRLKEACEQEKYVKLQKEACEREENEKKLRELREQEENQKREEEAHKKKANEQILNEVRELEETGKRQREVFEREENQKRQEAHKKEEYEKLEASQEAHVGKQEKQNLEAVEIFQERAEIEKKLKKTSDTCVPEEDPNSKATQGACEQEKNNEKLKLAQESCGHEENGSIMNTAECALEHKENEELKVASEQYGKERLMEACMAQRSSENEVCENKGEVTSKVILDVNEKKSGEPEEAFGQEKLEKCKKADQAAFDWEDDKNIHKAAEGVRQPIENGKKMEAAHPVCSLDEKRAKLKASNEFGTSQDIERKERVFTEILLREETGKERRLAREREQEKERLRKSEEERERVREREKDRMAVEQATREARERAFAEARERAERAAVERATAEVRQRALSEARERLEKASAEAREKSLAERASVEARLRAERAAVDRATAEARERARERVERSVSEKFSATSRDNGIRHSSSFSDLRDSQSSNSFNGSQRYSQSSNHGAFATEKSQGAEVESAQRCKARLMRHQRTVERAANALAEKSRRDLLAQREQAERNRLAETLDADVKRWSSGKEGNLRALLSTLQYILGPESGWQPVPLTEVITAVAVKKAYRKATLCVHPDKLQQRGASIQQKYICEKVFDLLKEAWNKFNSEER